MRSGKAPTTTRYDLVSQDLDEWGCGVACVASLTATPYEQAKELLEKVKGARIGATPKGLELHEIALALQEHRIYMVADWQEPAQANYRNGTIVCVGAADGRRDSHHYMLKTPSGWMDPWHNMGNKPRRAGYRVRFPKGKYFMVALVPKRGSKLR
ncbi:MULTISPECIES: hypothetical protein [unclassified Dyella]|uniref:hypothetical protein n=1 Tax=Dyella sp. ASV21 TaxID=2795114 RepID=UPI0018EBC58C|nr:MULTISPECIES: hypothetical protein [unclassified Dyella]